MAGVLAAAILIDEVSDYVAPVKGIAKAGIKNLFKEGVEHFAKKNSKDTIKSKPNQKPSEINSQNQFASSDKGQNIYRGDDNYTKGDIGKPEVQIKGEDIIKHVSGDSKDKKLVSFSTKLSKGSGNSRGAKFFSDNLVKTDANKVQGSIITPADAAKIISQNSKKKIRKQANNVKRTMEKNNEVLVNGIVKEKDIVKTN